MPATDTTPGWYPDPHHRFELRYHDGERWSDHVASGGVQITDRVSPAGPPATAPLTTTPPSSTATASTLTDEKRRQMAFTAMGCGAAMVLGTFLPWASSSGGSVNGAGIGIGYLTLLCGVGIAAYGYQALHAVVVRYHPGALTAIIVATLVASVANSGFETLDSATLGVGNIRPAIGFYLALFAPLVAIWPLVVFWRSYRSQLTARRVSAAGGVQPL